MNVLLFGANGQLGSDIVRLWDDPAIQLAGVTRADADVTDAGAVERLVAEYPEEHREVDVAARVRGAAHRRAEPE